MVDNLNLLRAVSVIQEGGSHQDYHDALHGVVRAKHRFVVDVELVGEHEPIDKEELELAVKNAILEFLSSLGGESSV